MRNAEELRKLEEVCKGKGIRVVYDEGVKDEGILFIGALKIAVVGKCASMADIHAIAHHLSTAS